MRQRRRRTEGKRRRKSKRRKMRLGMRWQNNDASDAMLSPLERLHAAQRRQLAESGGVHTTAGALGAGGMGNMQQGGKAHAGGGIPDPAAANTRPMEVKGRCVPGKVDLPGLVQKVSSAATQLAHRGGGANGSAGAHPSKVLSMPTMGGRGGVDPSKYGDPNVTPVVLVSPDQSTGGKDVQFLMTIDGITCAHCVKIVETVLKGCNGSRSPIDGLLDAVADQELKTLLIKIADASECRRIAHEATRNLSMVGYTAKAKGFNVPSDLTLGDVWGMMENALPSLAPTAGFQWGFDCRCPDNNIQRRNCPRHSQFGPHIHEMFDKTERLLSDLIAGCTKRTGLPCTAGHLCYCQSGKVAVKTEPQQQQHVQQQQQNRQPQDNSMYQENGNAQQQQQQQQQQQGANNNNNNGYMSYQQPIQDRAPAAAANGEDGSGGMMAGRQRERGGRSSMRMSIGRMSIGGLGGLGRHLSLTSETTFGRAMSGLSALSIDWENMDDFDINVDHSAGINNDIINGQQQQAAQQAQQQAQQQGQQGQGQGQQQGQENPNPAADGQQQQGGQENGAYGQQQQGGQMNGGPRVARRSSLRKNIPMNPNGNPLSYNVSFNM